MEGGVLHGDQDEDHFEMQRGKVDNIKQDLTWLTQLLLVDYSRTTQPQILGADAANDDVADTAASADVESPPPPPPATKRAKSVRGG